MGIDFITAIQESSTSFSGSFDSRIGRYTSESSKDWGIGYYLLHGQKDGFYCLNDFSRSTSGIVDIANQLIKYGESHGDVDHDEFSNQRTDSLTIDITDTSPWHEDHESQMEDVFSTVHNIFEDHSHSIHYAIEIKGKKIQKTIQNSSGTNVVQKFDYGLISIEMSLQENANVHTISQFGGIQQSDCNLDLISARIETEIKELQDMREARKIPPGNYDVILHPDSAYSLIHESIGHGSEADQIINGVSFLTNKIGHKVASSELTITDDPHLRGGGWSMYDDEGTKTKGTLLVEDGILVDYLHTMKTARILDTPPTGNARSTSYYETPEPRQSNLFVEPKDHSLEEMLEEVQNGILLGPTYLASTSIYSGEIHVESQYARIIKNGELEGYLYPTTLLGNALDILQGVSSVGDTLSKHPTECLKSRSRVNIGAYAPYLGINDVYLQ